MHIKVQYDLDPITLANASFLFSEKKRLLSFAIHLTNIFGFLIFVIMVVKLGLMGLLLNEWIVLLMVSLWLFGRKPFVRFIFKQKMKHSHLAGKNVSIDFSHNGIIWSGTGLQSNHLPWSNISYFMEVKNGFIIPYSLSRFLWVPFSEIHPKTHLEDLRSLIAAKQIPLRVYRRAQC